MELPTNQETRKVEVSLAVTIGLPNYSSVKALVGLEETFAAALDRQACIDELYTAIGRSVEAIVGEAKKGMVAAAPIEAKPPNGNFVEPKRLTPPVEPTDPTARFEATAGPGPVRVDPAALSVAMGTAEPRPAVLGTITVEDPLAGCPWGVVDSCRVLKTGNKKNGDPYTNYGIIISGIKMGTFSHAFAKMAQQAMAEGKRVQYRAAKSGQYLNLDLMKIEGGEWHKSD